MTRRDYCKKCNEMVGDWDPMCNKCHESFCYECFVTYDSVSRLCNLSAQLNAIKNPTITVEDLDQLCQDIQSNDFIEILKNTDINDLYEYEESLEDLDKLKNMLEFYTKSKDNMSRININKIKGILSEYLIEDFDICKCKECHDNINAK